MRVRCDYCGNYIEDTDKNCPHCGAPNDRMQRSGTKVPKTIEELKAFCAAHHLPLEQMRFFLGEDYRGPRAFGVYKDGEGNFVVYKNKSDGSRAIRYRGTDEAYAVNELYQKMKSEISNQRARQGKGGGTQGKSKGSSKSLIAILLAVYLSDPGRQLRAVFRVLELLRQRGPRGFQRERLLRRAGLRRGLG